MIREDIGFHTREWSPSELLKDVSGTVFLPSSSAERETRYANLWQGLCSESDAGALKEEINRRELLVTEDGARFIDLWSRDEKRHAEGFIMLLEILCGLDPAQTRHELALRTHDFSLINEHLADEFSLLALIAFDEIATCRGYSRDREFYAGLGHPAFFTWIKATIADEATHATNAVRVIHRHHSHRLAELDCILSRWTESAMSHRAYRGTFLMDSLELGYFREDFPEFAANLKRLVMNPALLETSAGKRVAF